MALTSTKLDEYRQRLEESNLDFHENRLSTYGGFQAFVDDTNNLIPMSSQFIEGRASEDRTASFVVLKRDTYSAGSSRSCTAGTQDSTSAYVTPSWTTWKFAIMHVPSQYAGNYVTAQADFDHKMTTVQRTILEALDTAAVTSLNTNKSLVNAASGNPYAFASGVNTVPLSGNDYFLNELGSQMLYNDLPEAPVSVIATPRFRAYVDRYINQGSANSANTQFQFGGFNFYYSKRITIATSLRDAVYAAPIGSLGFMPWVDIDARMGNVSGDGKEWFVNNLPLVGFDVGVLYQSTCGDKSSLLGGTEATLVESYSFSFDYVFVTAYNSTPSTNAGSIFKYNLTKA